MSQPWLLVVDDDRHLLYGMADWLRDQGFKVDAASTYQEAIAAIDKKSYDLALVDVRLGDANGFDILAHCRQNHPNTSVILITGYGSVDNAVEAIRAGAADFLTKPIIDEELNMAIQRTLNQRELIERNQRLTAQLDERFGLDNIIGQDQRMRRVFDMVDSIADTKATVLITGESGTGKSLIARAIHRRSQRRDCPFVEIACGALPETLLESELFGHTVGAFTGAINQKIGKFKQADTGTIFLDEIGTATPNLQVKMLRVLQEFEFEPVGSTITEKIDTRVVLATNEDLQQKVADGTFRQDLYYRVNVINIELPSLRERTSDIPLLAEYFLKQVCEDEGKEVHGFSEEAIATLQSYAWPGNVRELQNCVERAVLLGKGTQIAVSDLPATLSQSSPIHIQPIGSRTLKEALEGPERQIILDVLESNNWNRQMTSEQLGVNRTTLYKKMKRLGLEDAVQPTS